MMAAYRASFVQHSPAAYTHLELKIKMDQNHGQGKFHIVFANATYHPLGIPLPVHHPEYTNTGPPSEGSYTTFRIPTDDLFNGYSNLVAFSIFSTTERPVRAFIKDIVFLDYSTTLEPIPGWPVAPPQPEMNGPGRYFDPYQTASTSQTNSGTGTPTGTNSQTNSGTATGISTEEVEEDSGANCICVLSFLLAVISAIFALV